MLFWLFLGSAGFSGVQWLAFGRLDLLINIGFRTRALGNPGAFPLWYVLLEGAFDIGLALAAIARLHDIGRSGWWLAGLAAAVLMGAAAGEPAILLLAIAAWLALLFWPGTLGPNRYGRDPYGWESREQYHEQMRRLREPPVR